MEPTEKPPDARTPLDEQARAALPAQDGDALDEQDARGTAPAGDDEDPIFIPKALPAGRSTSSGSPAGTLDERDGDALPARDGAVNQAPSWDLIREDPTAAPPAAPWARAELEEGTRGSLYARIQGPPPTQKTAERLRIKRMKEVGNKSLQKPATADPIPKTALERIRAIIVDLQTKRANPRTLARGMRWRIVQFFMEIQPEVSNVAIADLLALSPNTIGHIKRALVRDAAYQITDLDALEVLSGLRIHKNAMQALALKNGDYSAAFKMETEYIEKLGDYGFIPRAAQVFENRNINLDLNKELEAFTHDYGIPTPGEFIAALRAGRLLSAGGGKPGNGTGGGNGSGRILEIPVLRGHSEDDDRGDTETPPPER